MHSIHEFPDERYYDSAPTERLASADDQPPIAQDYTFYLIGALLVAAGWCARGLLPVYVVTIFDLAWLVPLVTLIIASRRRIV